MDHDPHMRRAIELARENPSQPFGCVIVNARGEIVSEAFNDGENPVRHGEAAAIYDLAQKNSEVDWSSLTLYTTAEPCPMCSGAILWSGLGSVIIGTKIETLIELGLPQINVPIQTVCDSASKDFTPPEMSFGLLREECDALYRALVRQES